MATVPPRRTHLAATAKKAMLQYGFVPDFPPAALAELAQAEQRAAQVTAAAAVKDLRELLWSSIDNMESKDLDQIEVAERVGVDIRVLVGVADVDALVSKGSALDVRAAANTCSIYTGVATFPMLPEVLSTNLTSLNQDVDRLAIVLEFVVKPDGALGTSSVYRAKVRNHAQLAYDELADFLEGKGPVPPRVSRLPALADQLKLQDEAAQRLRHLRHDHGALELETIEAHPVTKDGEVVSLEVTKKSHSRELIEDFMIAANGVMARYLEGKHRPGLARVVKTPKRWDRIVQLAGALGVKLPADPDPVALANFLTGQRAKDPLHFGDLSLSVVKLLGPGEYVVNSDAHRSEGHFGLAVQDYTHSTAPNRRYSDLITQRLLKATLTDSPPPYTEEELGPIAQHCTAKEDDERRVERFMRKVAAADFLSHHIGEIYDAIVTGVGDKGTFVRLIAPPAEGRVVQGNTGLDVGDSLKVKLLATTPDKGFVDFARA